jgi:hypothetical protein
LFKQSGFMLLAVAFALPFARLRRDLAHGWNWRPVVINCCLVAAIIIGSELLGEAGPAFGLQRHEGSVQWQMGHDAG